MAKLGQCLLVTIPHNESECQRLTGSQILAPMNGYRLFPRLIPDELLLFLSKQKEAESIRVHRKHTLYLAFLLLYRLARLYTYLAKRSMVSVGK